MEGPALTGEATSAVSDARRPLRIAQICPYSLSYHGGVQAQVFGLARTLRRRGHDVAVVGPCDGDPLDDAGVFDVGTTVPVEANGSIAPIAIDHRVARRTLSTLRRLDCDVVHLHEPLVPGPCLTTTIAAPVPLVGTFHLSGASASYRFLNPLVVSWARHLNVRCAVSDEARATAEGSLGGEYRILFNGVDVDRFAQARRSRDRAASEGGGARDPVIAFVGRHEERKGLGILLEAFAAVHDARLVIAGDGPDSQSLRRRYGPDPRIEWVGRIDDDAVVALMARADVVCAPSLGGESFGIVVVEALAAGAAVIASDIPGYRAAAGDAVTLVAPGDVRGWTEAITAVADVVRTGALVDAIENDAGAQWAQRYSMDALAEAYEEIYRSL